MLNINYTETGILLSFIHNDIDIHVEEWFKYISDFRIINVINDLLANGIAEKYDENNIFITYERVCKLDAFEKEQLSIINYYPHDIFIGINGSGLKDKFHRITYSFQDYAFDNGSGSVFNFKRVGAYLENTDSRYLLNYNQYLLLDFIDNANRYDFLSNSDSMLSCARIKKMAITAGCALAAIFNDTEIIELEKVSLDIVRNVDETITISPLIENVSNNVNNSFKDKFNHALKVRDEYSFRDQKDIKHRVVTNSSKSNIQGELEKLKNKNTFSIEEVSSQLDNPTKYWNVDCINLDDFSSRVIELGIYKPKFYPFISPYKSEWIPGIAIKDKIDGNRHIPINTQEDLLELKILEQEALASNSKNILYKGEDIDTSCLPEIISNAESQLKSPNTPVVCEKSEDVKLNKVLIIKENTLELEYNEINNNQHIEKYNFHKIDNLSDGIIIKDHQKEGIAWLQTLFEKPISASGGLLADDMGLGKTIQVLSFIEWYANANNKPILIIAPVSLLENWANEHVKFFDKSSLEIVTLRGKTLREYIIPNNIEETISNFDNNKIYLSTYETLRRQQIAFCLVDWGVVVLDEVQKIKTPGTLVTNSAKALKSDFKIAMTGTPVENSLMDLWCIMDFCCPGLLSNAKAFSKKYQNPLNNSDTDYKQLSLDLRDEIGDYLIRRLKKDVAKELPTIEYLYFKEQMPQIQLDTYNNEIERIKVSVRDGENSQILVGLFNLKSISDHPMIKNYTIENIDVTDLIDSSAKLKVTINILKDIKSKDEKVIIFSNSKNMQRILRRVIRDVFLLDAIIINGDTPTEVKKTKKVNLTRQQHIDKFQLKEGFNIIIMSPIAAGFGLNVTEANHVIHYTRHWNPAKEQQATDRAYRIGQTRDVKVYYPMAIEPNGLYESFDVIIDTLLKRKSHLASETLFPTEQIEIGKKDFVDFLGFEGVVPKAIILKTLNDVIKLNPLNFEAAVALIMERQFTGRSLLTPKSNDKGADIVFFSDRVNYLIQVKQSVSKISSDAGQEVFYSRVFYENKYDCTFKLMVVTNNIYTSEAIARARGNKVELINGDILEYWINRNTISLIDVEDKYLDREG